uniref:Testis expressed 44 n=1 Tax=Molossus molossus TaxID=27622 RepID=A0A7J8FVV5_MOLMO|nr:testis expressed 44 [Molossus molossus]
MTIVPLGEASIPTHGDSRCSDGPAVGSQGQGPLPADVPAARGTPAQLSSSKPAASKATSVSGDRDRNEDEAAAGHRQEPEEPKGQPAHPAPDALQTSMSLQNLVRDGLAQESRTSPSLRISQSDSLVKGGTPQTMSVPDGKQDLEPPTPSAEVRSLQNVPTVNTADADSQPDTWATSTIEAVEKSEDPETLNPDTEALPSAESQAGTEGDLLDSEDLQAGPVPPSPGSSVPASHSAPTVALGRRPLDSSLHMASEEDTYMRSMTGLLGGGEGSISSLAHILVWSETTMAMATGFLESGHSSVTDLLHSTGPSLFSTSSILQNASSAFSSGLGAGTSSVFRSITHMLERMEQRTVESIRSAMSYMTSHLTPLWPQQ